MEFVADLLYELPKNYHLLFDASLFIICLHGERADMGESFESCAKTHPLASYISSMVLCFAHLILVAFMCGEPILGAFNDPWALILATLLWFLMFYCPNDAVYKITKLKPFKIPLYIVKGLYYPKKIAYGIKHARHVFHGNFLAAVIIATLKANGAAFLKPVARFIRGQTSNIETGIETLKPSLTTKWCFTCAVIYSLLPNDLTYILISGILVAQKLCHLFPIPADVFTPVESKVCPIIFGTVGAKEEAKKD